MIKTRKTIFRRILTQVIALSLCSVSLGFAIMPHVAPAAEDPYLKALAEEAERNAKLSKQQASSKAAPAATPAPATEKASAGNAEYQTQFEQMLENERPATYHFYAQLPDQAKSSVVQVYKESNKISTASKKVFDLYFKQMKK